MDHHVDAVRRELLRRFPALTLIDDQAGFRVFSAVFGLHSLRTTS